jgi:crossover junction endodeoxyribonuclease RuvC
VRVLGVDPGLTRCGVGVVDGEPGRGAALVEVGVLRTPTAEPVAARLTALEQGVNDWIDRHQPDAVAVERVFSQANVRTVMGTAQAGAVAIVAAARRGLPVALYTPSEVKAAVSGSGRADKHQVTFMVTRLLALPEPPKPADAADALALALCHLWRGPALARLTAARGAGRGSRPRVGGASGGGASGRDAPGGGASGGALPGGGVAGGAVSGGGVAGGAVSDGGVAGGAVSDGAVSDGAVSGDTGSAGVRSGDVLPFGRPAVGR